jgi:hypothetical protein
MIGGSVTVELLQGLEFTKQMGIANCPTVRGVLLIRHIRLKKLTMKERA